MCHYLGFVLIVVEHYEIEFSSVPPDPISIARGYIDGIISVEQSAKAKQAWWDYIDNHVGIRDFRTVDALSARIALLLLIGKNNEVAKLGRTLEWLFEVLNMYELNTDVEFDTNWAETFATHYFKFESSS
jgi:hypothetical protein